MSNFLNKINVFSISSAWVPSDYNGQKSTELNSSDIFDVDPSLKS